MTTRKLYTPELCSMREIEVKRLAVQKLQQLETIASMRLLSNLSRISRTTLLRWLECDPYEIDFKTAAWFVVATETDFRMRDLSDRVAKRPVHSVIEGRKATLGNTDVTVAEQEGF